MAGDARYVAWIRQQPCAVCGTTFQVQAHHALYGTTYSPEETRPAKAIEGARKGGAQKSHDYFCIPLCLKHHEPGIHQLGNHFDGWSRAEANAWEEQQVSAHRNRYAMQCPTPVLAAAAPAARTRNAPGPSADAASRERARIARVIRDRAAERHHLPDQHALLSELADDIDAGLNDTGSF